MSIRHLEDYIYPVYGTQGGGLAREFHGSYFFIEAPRGVGLLPGDEVPPDWGLEPANLLARKAQEALDLGSVTFRAMSYTDDI